MKNLPQWKSKKSEDVLSKTSIFIKKEDDFNFDINIKGSDLSTIIYTSGTSGYPKGVMLSHSTIIHNCYAAYELLKDFNFSNERFLSFLPLSHSYEHTAGQFLPVAVSSQIFYAENLEKLFTNFKNVVMTRTFSKIYGLAGLRVGWGYGSKKIVDALNVIKPPFNVNKIAQLCAIEALKDNKFIRKSIKHN